MRRLVCLVAVAACSSKSGGSGPSLSNDHPRIYIAANKDRLSTALQAGTPAATRFKKMVDSQLNGGDVYGFENWNAALLGQLTGDASYCTAAVKAVDTEVTTAQSEIAGGDAPDVSSDDYLDVGDDIGDLALVYDWCYDTLTSDQRTAWLAYANQAVTNVWNPDSATWGGSAASWDGWAIDDPDDNYYYSFLRATMLLGLAAHGEYDGIDQWVTEFHDTKLVGELVPNFDMDLQGGGSREGTGYGVSLRDLFELYDLWAASTTEDIATMTPHTRASMLDFIHQVVPTLDRVAPTGDQSRDSTASFFDYHRMFLEELVHLFPTDPLAAPALALLQNCSVPAMTQEFMYVYDFLLDSDTAPSSLDGLGTTYYAPGTGQFYSRSGWDTHATWINTNMGPYTESHAHQDQGALIIYKDGYLAYDPVIDSHSGLPQDVDEHGTIRVVKGGKPVAQDVGNSSTLLALHAGTGYVHVAADLTVLEGSAATKLQREIVYLQPDTVVIYDRVTTPAANQQVWSLAFPATPSISGATTTVTASGHTLNVQRLGPAAATSSIYDFTMNSDFSNGFRLDETMAGGDNRWLHVATIDGSATNITSPDGNTVTLTLADGTAVTLAFNADDVGATLMLGSQSITLGAGIDTLPE
ncbi:MAG TPA: hypothetical protein VH143_27540 [Kofleriaceae bacterium]|nr:hypothetical protein [Kofleriaceae bacterium]